jgi:DNA mismatch repair protein MutL
MDPLRGFQPKHEEESQAELPAISQFQGQYIITQTKSGIVIIDQQNAHERILYEKYMKEEKGNDPGSQRLLMPQTYNSGPDETPLLEELTAPMKELGFDISAFGKDTFLIHAVPQGTNESDVKQVLESILEDYKKDMQVSAGDSKIQVARSLARRLAVKKGKKLRTEEMRSIMENLFACSVPELSPDGKPTMMILPWEDLAKKFKS